MPNPTLSTLLGSTRNAALEVRYSKETTIPRSEEHTSELQSPTGISYAVFCLKKIFLMIRRPPRSTPAMTLFPSRRSSDLSGVPLALHAYEYLANDLGHLNQQPESCQALRADRKSTRLNSSHRLESRMPSSA